MSIQTFKNVSTLRREYPKRSEQRECMRIGVTCVIRQILDRVLVGVGMATGHGDVLAGDFARQEADEACTKARCECASVEIRHSVSECVGVGVIVLVRV